MSDQDCYGHPRLKPLQILSGTAKGRTGPSIGLTDIGESEKAYLCKVAMPGLKKNECKMEFHIQNDGKVEIRGATTMKTGIMLKSTSIYEMKLNQLCPPGDFTVSFHLPGPVDGRVFSSTFDDGILELVVSKLQLAPKGLVVVS